MKNILASVIVVALLSVGYFLYQNLTPSRSEKEEAKFDKSIAVLPCVNMSNDPGQDYYSDGMTEGILISLAHLKCLKISARPPSFGFRGKEMETQTRG